MLHTTLSVTPAHPVNTVLSLQRIPEKCHDTGLKPEKKRRLFLFSQGTHCPNYLLNGTFNLFRIVPNYKKHINNYLIFCFKS